MSEGFFEALSQITRERKVDRDVLLDALATGLRSAVRRKHGADAEVDVSILPEKGEIAVHLVKTVVTEEDLGNEELDLNEDAILTVEEALEFLDEPAAGDVIRIPMDVKEFGRNAILTAKQVLVQGVKEAVRDNVFNEFSDRVGEIVTGTVQQVDRGNILVSLGRTEAMLPYREQIRRERFHQAETIRGLIIEVQRESRGPQVLLSRSHPDFLLRLFEQEIPEVYEGLVEIKGVAREPGWRSKVAVYSRDDRVDAVGACVGMKGARVMSIVKELSGERIDIVPWDPDTSTFVSRALSPAQVSSIRILEGEEASMLVVVEEDQLSLAIGKEGQNVRLAAKLTGWKLDLVTHDTLKIREKAEEFARLDIAELAGVSDRLAELLREAGIATVQALAKTPLESVLEVPSVGEKTAEKLLANAEVALAELAEAKAEFMEAERQALEDKRLKESDIFKEEFYEGDEEKEQAEPAVEEVATLTFKDLDDEDEAVGEEVTEEEAEAAEPAEAVEPAGDDG